MSWISLQDEEPEDSSKVLVLDSVSNAISLAIFREEECCFDVMSLEEVEIDYCVTHWQYLPLPLSHPLFTEEHD